MSASAYVCECICLFSVCVSVSERVHTSPSTQMTLKKHQKQVEIVQVCLGPRSRSKFLQSQEVLGSEGLQQMKPCKPQLHLLPSAASHSRVAKESRQS